MTQLNLQTQSAEMKALKLHPTLSEGTKHAFTCRNGVHTFIRVALTFLRVRLALVRQTFSDFQMEGKKPGYCQCR